MDPRALSPPPGGMYPSPSGWMGPPGTPLPPGMAGMPPPGWVPMPPPNGPPHFMKLPPPGMPFMPHPGMFPQNPGQYPRPFMPLGAIPPPPSDTLQPPPMPSLAPPQGATSAPASPLPPPVLVPTQGNHSNSQTPRRSMHSRAPSAGRSTPRARSASSHAAGAHGTDTQPGSPWSVSNASFPSSPQAKGSLSSRQQQNKAPASAQGGSGFGSSSNRGNASPAPSRPQSGAAARSPKRASSAAPKRAGSARPFSAATTTGGGGFTPLDDNDNIKVAIRVRPLNATELARGDACVVQINPEEPKQVVLTVPHTATSAPSSSHWLSPSGAPPTSRSFQFHSCIGPEAGQDDVMRQCGITNLLDAALDGYNATILAYGQTGSGKTYTISGRDDDTTNNNFQQFNDEYSSSNDDGIVSRSLAYIYSQLDARNAALSASDLPAGTAGTSPDPTASSTILLGDGCRYSVRTSYSEIYNEALYDLLCFDQRQLSLRWDPVKGFHAPDLTLQDCPELVNAQEVVARGLRHRRVGSHALNLESSRSHAIFTVHIDAVPMRPGAEDYGSTRMGKVVFVDLAGSERLKDSQSEGTAMRETASINRSLFMLGKVISALASGAKGAIVPYRESKLTKLLMDSLGGSAMSLMIACCSPSAVHLEETLSTLSYATRAKNIKNAPAVQMDPHQAALAALRRELRLLRTENAFLREQLMMAAGTARIEDGVLGAAGGAASSAGGLPALPSVNAVSPGASPSPGAVLPAQSVMLPVPNPAHEELSRRLADSQRLLGTLSSENSRLAAENERLRAGGLQVAGEYSGAVEEIEWLRSKLARLEASLMGAALTEGGELPASPGAIASGVNEGMGAKIDQDPTVDASVAHQIAALPGTQPIEMTNNLGSKLFGNGALPEAREIAAMEATTAPRETPKMLDEPEIDAKSPNVVYRNEREADNGPVQSLSSEVFAPNFDLLAQARAAPLPGGPSLDDELAINNYRVDKMHEEESNSAQESHYGAVPFSSASRASSLAASPQTGNVGRSITISSTDSDGF